MTIESQKEVASHLDAYASNCMDPSRSATTKQCWFLAGLLLKSGDWERHGVNSITCGNTGYQLTKGRASRFIDDLVRGN